MREARLVETSEEGGLNRRDILVTGGLLAAGATFLGAPGFAYGARAAGSVKVAVVTHGDTGSFWSVFKKGVDQAAKDLKSRGVSVTQVYANNDVAKQVTGINAAVAAKANVIATSVPDANALKGALTKAAARKIEIITVNSGLGAFDSLPTYMVHVGQTEDIAGQGAGKQFKAAGTKKVLVVIHEASNSGLQQRATGVKKIMGGGAVKTLVIPEAKSDIPGTKAKVQAAFKADKSLSCPRGSRALLRDSVTRSCHIHSWANQPRIATGHVRGVCYCWLIDLRYRNRGRIVSRALVGSVFSWIWRFAT